MKHYRNQYVHDKLDRFAALELLLWGRNGIITKEISFDVQQQYILSFQNMLSVVGYSITIDDQMMIEHNNKKKRLIVYPAMRAVECADNDIIYVSDSYMKYAKPYALRKIIRAFE